MICPQCEIWELIERDNFCSWCGKNFVSFEVRLDRQSIALSEYPPPVEVVVANPSEGRTIVVQSIATSADWISLLDLESVPRIVAPGHQEIFLLDFNTIHPAASSGSGEITVSVAHGGSKSGKVMVL